jgi:hypothetical protein
MPNRNLESIWDNRSMTISMTEPVVCPHCSKLLQTVQVAKTIVISYSEEEECWEDNGQGNIIVICYLCGKVIGTQDANGTYGIFPDCIEW